MLPQREDKELYPYLQQGMMQDARTWLDMPADFDTALADAVQRMAEGVEHPLWKAFNDDHRRLFHAPRLEELRFSKPKDMQPLLGSLWPVYECILLLSGLPDLLAFHKAFHIPEAITKATLADMVLWVKEYKRKQGVWGCNELGWLQYHFTGRLYRLGRLQFMTARYEGHVYVYRHNDTGAYVVLAGDDITIRQDGYVNGTCGRSEAGWVPAYKREDDRVIGHRSVEGRVLAEAEILPLNTHAPFLMPGDTILEIHVPKDGRLEPEACMDSFRQALQFFPQHFPQDAFAAFTCQSWLLSPGFMHILPHSNIRWFCEQFIQLPQQGSESQLYERVYDCDSPAEKTTQAIDQLPQDTQLQRVLAQAIRSEDIPGGFGFFPIDQINHMTSDL